jgi:hypothetical protein
MSRYIRFNVSFLTATAFSLGYLMNDTPSEPPPLKIEGSAWCFVAEYATWDQYEMEKPLPHSLIDVHGKGVRVYERCNGSDEGTAKAVDN